MGREPAQQPSIESELNEAHEAAKRAFRCKDLEAYRNGFSPSLTYRQADGTIIDRDQLMRQVAQQFRALTYVNSSFVRERLSVVDERVTEILLQEASLEATAFGFAHRSWKLIRRGEYEWIKMGAAWVIQHVQVHSETVRHAGWRLGPKRPEEK
jgi:hypothetical protein